MSETLGQKLERELSVAVELGLITEAEKDDWVKHPPRSPEQADYVRFILKIVRG